MEHTSGFRPPGRDIPRARDAKRTRHDHASRNYQKHLAERFKEREAQRKTGATVVPEPKDDDSTA